MRRRASVPIQAVTTPARGCADGCRGAMADDAIILAYPILRGSLEMPMYVIDRNLAVIKPKQPFLDWLRKTPGHEVDLTLEQLRLDCTALLIPEFEEPEDAVAFIDEIGVELFEAELGSWVDDASQWPKERSLANFWLWFDVEIHGTVVDLVDEAVPADTPTPQRGERSAGGR
jgi:hypothetical protein